MKNHEQYIKGILSMFSLYKDYNKITLDELESYLIVIETAILSTYKNKENKLMWIKFTNDDNIVHSINEIIADLQCKTNREYILTCIETAIKNKSQVKIFCS
jgi:hypothetical protein